MNWLTVINPSLEPIYNSYSYSYTTSLISSNSNPLTLTKDEALNFEPTLRLKHLAESGFCQESCLVLFCSNVVRWLLELNWNSNLKDAYSSKYLCSFQLAMICLKASIFVATEGTVERATQPPVFRFGKLCLDLNSTIKRCDKRPVQLIQSQAVR